MRGLSEPCAGYKGGWQSKQPTCYVLWKQWAWLVREPPKEQGVFTSGPLHFPLPVCRHFPRCPHSRLPLCSRTVSVSKFDVTSTPGHIHLPCSLHWVLPSRHCLGRALVYLLPVSSVRAESTGLCSRLPPSNSGPLCGVGEAVSLVAEMIQSLLWGIPVSQSGTSFPTFSLCLSGCSFLPERTGVAPGGRQRV